MKKILMLTALGVMCVTAPAFANKEHMEKKADFYLGKMDTDKDGSVSKAEHEEFADTMFKQADTNTDDKLSRQEIIDQKSREKQEMKDAGLMDDKDDDKSKKE